MNHLEVRPFERVVAGASDFLGEAERLHNAYSSLNSVDFKGVDFWQNQNGLVVWVTFEKVDLESMPQMVKAELFDYYGLKTDKPLISTMTFCQNSFCWTVEPDESQAAYGCGFTIESADLEAYLIAGPGFFEGLKEGLKWMGRVIESRRLGSGAS